MLMDLEHLKNEAKALLKAHTRGDASVCDVFRRLNRFAHAADSQIFSAEIPLTEAQFALAMAYGFASWEALRKAVLDCQPLEGSGTARLYKTPECVWASPLHPFMSASGKLSPGPLRV